MTRRFPYAPTIAAAGLALAAPMLGQAHDYRSFESACTDRIHDNGVTGALVGGVAGAVIGSNLAHGGGRTGGALLGGAAGAAVGSNIARSSTKSSCREPRAAYRYAPPPLATYPPPPAEYVYYPDEPRRHDNGLHRGWYKHHRHHEDDDGDDD